MALIAVYGERTVNEMILLFRNGQINLEPGFQRKSVWSLTDRRRLTESIVSNYPLPNIFLYRRSSKGKTIYDVIDGKQRLETILMFLGIGRFKHMQFDVKLDLDEDGLCPWDWQCICKWADNIRHRFECFQLQTVEVSGEFSEIVDLFVRINSTGKRLTSGEKRNARFFECCFLQEANKLLTRYKEYFLNQRILSSVQIDRMKGTELISELLVSIHHGGLINKKTALDRAIGNDSIKANTLARIVREFKTTIGIIKRMFPDIKQTRFKNTAEFYSLFMLIWEMNHERLVLNDSIRNQIAFELLSKLSTGVDEIREQYRQAKETKPRAPYSEYLLTVQGDTDSSATRQRRSKVLKGILRPIFEIKDNKRAFSPEQRRILWNTDVSQKCSKCSKKLNWSDFTVDHIKAYSRGGNTVIDNAQLMCKSCNSRKGNRAL